MVFVLRFHRPCLKIYVGLIYFFLELTFKKNVEGPIYIENAYNKKYAFQTLSFKNNKSPQFALFEPNRVETI